MVGFGVRGSRRGFEIVALGFGVFSTSSDALKWNPLPEADWSPHRNGTTPCLGPRRRSPFSPPLSSVD